MESSASGNTSYVVYMKIYFGFKLGQTSPDDSWTEHFLRFPVTICESEMIENTVQF